MSRPDATTWASRLADKSLAAVIRLRANLDPEDVAAISERVVRGTPGTATEAETAALERLARDLEVMAGRLGEP